jgi:tetratricopeptide (TPR) repeat protein
MWSLMRGAPDAERLALAAFETRTRIANVSDNAPLQLFEIRYRQGRLAEMADAIRAGAASAPNMPAWRIGLVLLYCESNLLDEAREHFEPFAANGLDLPLDWNWVGWMFMLAEACDVLGDARAAQPLYVKFRPLAEQVGVLGSNQLCVGSLGHAAGVLAACMQHWDDAERHFEHAVAMNDRLGARPAAVRTRRAYAAMLLERNAPGDQSRAADLITAALAETEQLDVPAEAAKLQRLRERLA